MFEEQLRQANYSPHHVMNVRPSVRRSAVKSPTRIFSVCLENSHEFSTQGNEQREYVTGVGSADIWLRVLGRAGSTREGRLDVLERNKFQNEPPGNRILVFIQLNGGHD